MKYKNIKSILLFQFLIFFILIIFNPLLKSQNQVLVDGIISENEYSNKFIFDNNNYILYAQIINDIVYFGIESTAKGWVSIGLDPSSRMKDADMIFGIVTDKEVKAFDEFCPNLFGPHYDDKSLGGSYDILSFAGKRDAQKIVFEFSRKLDTKDSKDKIVVQGKELKIIWAYSDSNDLVAKHSKRGSSSIIIK